MIVTDIKPGKKLELEIFNRLGDRAENMLVSEFEWMDLESGHCFIAAPIFEGVLYPVHVGTDLNIYFIDMSVLYRIQAIVTGRSSKDNIELLEIELKSEPQKIQRRNFFRFEWRRPVKYRVIDSLKPSISEQDPFISAVTRDLSGGGICILAEDKISVGKTVECQLLLEEGNIIEFYGKIIRQSVYDLELKYKYEMGIWFKKIENKDREALISYIFQEQRRLRKKGLI